MIEFNSLGYRYPQTEQSALRSIDLLIQSGEALLLSGMSGSGKSTILRVINGLVPHFFGGVFKGEARIDGQDTRKSSPIKLAATVGTVFQEPRNRFLTSSVEDEIAFGLELAGLPGYEIHKRVADMMDHFNLGHLMDRKLDHLSAGEQQRVAIAAALGRIPKVLILDEPTSQLDPMASRAVLGWVSDLKTDFGLTMIIAEHRLDRLMPFVNRIAHLSGDGSLETVGSLDEVIPRVPLASSISRAMQKLNLSVTLDSGECEELIQRISQLSPGPAKGSAEGTKPVLITQGLEYNYNGIPALRQVNIYLHPGEIVALVGHNGAGKSTLMRCLVGLLTPDQGEIFIEGNPMQGRPVSDFARQIAYVPQWPSSLLFADTVEEELRITLKNHGLEQDPPLDPIEFLAQFGLADLRHRYPRDLSAGQRQRVALASVLVTKPRIILLDEPSLGMDPQAQTNLSEILHSWRANGTAILVATHDVEFAGAYADRVIIMENGEIESTGPPAEVLFSKPELRTSLQRLTGVPWPASPEQIEFVEGERGALD